MKAKKRPAPPRKCQMSCLKGGISSILKKYIPFSPALPVVVAQQLTVLVHVPGLRRGDVRVLLFVYKVVEGRDSAEQAANCRRNIYFVWQIDVVTHPDKALTVYRGLLQRCTS